MLAFKAYQNADFFKHDLGIAETISDTTLNPIQREECWRLYCNAQKNTRVLGNLEYVMDKNVLVNFGSVYGTDFYTRPAGAPREWPTMSRLQTLRESTSPQRQIPLKQRFIDSARTIHRSRIPANGAILNTVDWTTLDNDALIIATCHRAAKMYPNADPIEIALPEDFIHDPMKYLWDDKRNRPRVTGREFLGLIKLFGFVFRITKSKTAIFFQLELQNSIKAANANFKDYAEFMQNPALNRHYMEHEIRTAIQAAQWVTFH